MTQLPNGRTSTPELDISQWLNIDELCSSEGNTETIDQGSDAHGRPAQGGRPSSLPGSLIPIAEPADEEHPTSKTTQLSKDLKTKPETSERFSVICFPSDPARPEGKKKKRRDFTERRRQEVAQIRKSGACLRCKIRRTSVSLPSDSTKA